MLPVYTLSSGPNVLLAFHGIGQDYACFEPLAAALDGQYTVYAFDLFFHGDNESAIGEETLTKAAWKRLITDFLLQHGIDRFSVAGFSMGGKFALATAESFTDQLDELWLIAPDGITTSPFYTLATRTAVGRALFRYFLRHMPLFHRVGQILSRLKLVDRSTLRFAESTLSSPGQRERVYKSWTYFRDLRFNIDQLAQTLNQSSVQVRFFLGYFDRVLPKSFVHPLTRRLHAYEMRVLRTGHHRLIEKVAESFRSQRPLQHRHQP